MIVKLRKATSSIVRFIFKVLSTIEVHGLENIPTQGGCALVMNHLSRIDPALAYIVLEEHHLLDDRQMTALVADKYKRVPVISWLVNIFGGIWINREEADFHAIRKARDFMEQGGMLGIAPEGTRSHTQSLIRGKTGAAFLTNQVGVPLVPIAVTGTEKAFRTLARFRRPHFTFQVGEPFRLPPLDRKDRSASLRRNTDELMCRIAAMLPPEYHGVYTDHPQLQELLRAA